MDQFFRQSYTVHDCDVDRFGYLTPSQMLFYAQDTAARHCQLLSVDHGHLAQKGLFWAVIRHRVQICRYPQSGETITVETWPMPTTRSAYPRSTVAYDESGNEVFRAISLWVLMDSNTRAMVLPGKSGVEVCGMLRGSELAAPGSLALSQGGHCAQRQVAFTDLDRNGHMNNCRYLDWIADLLPSPFHAKHRPKELTVCYLNEAREGQRMKLCWSLSDGPALQADGLHDPEELSAGHSRVFSVKMLF